MLEILTILAGVALFLIFSLVITVILAAIYVFIGNVAQMDSDFHDDDE